MTADENLIKVLDAQRATALQAFRDPYERTMGPDPFEPVKAAMAAHPEFAERTSHTFLGRQILFWNELQASNLLRVSVKRGGAEALRWYRRVRATRTTGVKVVVSIYGLLVGDPVTLSNSMKIIKTRDLSDHPNAAAAKRQSGFFESSDAAAVLEIASIDAVDSERHQESYERFMEIVDNIRMAVAACTLSDGAAAPTVAEAWIEFLDSELEAATTMQTWQGSRHEGRHAFTPATMDENMIAWIEKYLQLPTEVARKCRVPIERLNLARRRRQIGDMAIDASIGLEALLVNGGHGELTHRLSVRTALLLGRSLKERRTIKDAVRDFYEVRSRQVHGSSEPVTEKDKEIVHEGLRLLLLAIQAVIDSGVTPSPATWELTGGPLQNRFHE